MFIFRKAATAEEGGEPDATNGARQLAFIAAAARKELVAAGFLPAAPVCPLHKMFKGQGLLPGSDNGLAQQALLRAVAT